MAWDKRDLQILAEGMLIGGRYNLANISGYAPRVWNDPGDYTGLYMDFLKLLADFSPIQFAECVRLFGAGGEIKITNAEKAPGSDMVVRVSCDLSREGQGVDLFGRANSWLTWRNGTSVPTFVVSHTVAGLATTLPLAYVFERGAIPGPGFEMAEEPLFQYWGTRAAGAAEAGSIVLPPLPAAEEDIVITYS